MLFSDCGTGLSRSTSLTSCTNQLSLDDDSDSGSKGVSSSLDSPDTATPLDLSAKPANRTSDHVGVQTNDPGTDAGQDCSFVVLLQNAKWPKSSNSVNGTQKNVQQNVDETAKAVNDLLCSVEKDSRYTSVDNSISSRNPNVPDNQTTDVPSGGDSVCSTSVQTSRRLRLDIGHNGPSLAGTQPSYPLQSVINSIQTNVQDTGSGNVSNLHSISSTTDNVTDHTSDTLHKSFSNSSAGSSNIQTHSNSQLDPFTACHRMLSCLEQMSPVTSVPPATSDTKSLSNASGIQQLHPDPSKPQGVQISSGSSLHGMLKPVMQNQNDSTMPLTLPGNTSSLQSNQPSSPVSNPGSSLRRSLSSSGSMYFNPLTLPLSQNKLSYKRSMSVSTGLDFDDKSGSTAMVSQPTNQSISHNPPPGSFKSASDALRSPSPTNSYNLPPKKQRRYYSNAAHTETCTKCLGNIVGQKLSQCPNGHSSCTKCLEERVKLVLTGKAKVSTAFFSTLIDM